MALPPSVIMPALEIGPTTKGRRPRPTGGPGDSPIRAQLRTYGSPQEGLLGKLGIPEVSAGRARTPVSGVVCSGASGGGSSRYGALPAARARRVRSTGAARSCALSVSVAENETRGGGRARGGAGG